MSRKDKGMGFYSPQTEVVDLGGGNTVTIRKLTYGETSDLLSAAAANGMIDGMRYSRLRVDKCVVSWDGPGFEGRAPTPENIAALPTKVGQAIAKAAQDLNNDLDDDEGNASGGATS